MAATTTVVVVCFNHRQFIGECLDSISNQTTDEFDLLIFDDYSTDDSAEFISEWLESFSGNVRFIRHAHNQGLIPTLREALSMVEGEFFSLISADDYMYADKLAVQVRELRSDPDLGFVYSDANRIDEHGEPLSETWMQWLGVKEPPSGEIFLPLLCQNSVPLMAATIRTAILRAAGGFEDSLWIEDWDTTVRLAHRAPAFFSTYVSAAYRMLPTSLSRTMPDWQRAMSDLRVLRFWLGESPEIDEFVRRRIMIVAYCLWETKHQDRWHELAKSVLQTRRPYSVVLASLAIIGVPLSWLVASRKFLRRLMHIVQRTVEVDAQ